MKKIICLLFFFCIAAFAHAQETDYQGPAKNAINAFWEGVAKIEKSIASGVTDPDRELLVGLAKKIREIKAQDATYNTAAMETKYKTLSGGLTTPVKRGDPDKQSRDAANRNSMQVTKILNSLFHISTQVDNRRLGTIKQEIEEYKKNTEQLLTMDTSRNSTDLRGHRVQLKTSFKSAENDLYELDRRCREQTKPENAEVKYYELLFNQAYWDAAQRVYPNEPDFKKAYTLATSLLKGLGSIDDVHQLASKSKQQKINDTRLPVAAAKDVALEKMFMDAFNKFHGEEFKGTATKAVLTSDDWSIERNDITGIVTGRVRRAVIVYKGTDGKCYLTANFFLRQEYVGSSYSNTPISKFPIMGSQEMLCSNVK